jgi:Na+-driven multidrug efflux pump
MGRMKMTILGTTSQISIRTLFTILLAQKMGIQGIAYASMIGWSAMLLFEVPIALHELSDMKE